MLVNVAKSSSSLCFTLVYDTLIGSDSHGQCPSGGSTGDFYRIRVMVCYTCAIYK